MPTLKEIAEELGYTTIAEFTKDWKKLTPQDKEEIKEAIDGA